MITQKVLKANKLIRQEVGKIILSEINFPTDVMVTIIKAETSKDLRYVDVFISILPSDKTTETEKALKENIYFIQGKLNRRIQINPLPRIRFIIDESGKYVSKIEELIKKNKL